MCALLAAVEGSRCLARDAVLVWCAATAVPCLQVSTDPFMFG